MSRPEPDRPFAFLLALLILPTVAVAEGSPLPNTQHRPDHRESARAHSAAPDRLPEDPALPPGRTLDEVLTEASTPPPEDFPHTIPDPLHYFVLGEQIEYRVKDEKGDELGWEMQGWVGYDYDRFVWKSEGEAVFEGPDEGESETDFLYSRLIGPFLSAQIGFQYANGWESGGYSERWSGALALQGIAPGKFEFDTSLYVSDHADVTVEVEAEYNVRLTQRLVFQPRTELGFAFQDVSERSLASGMTDAVIDLRLRYELMREIAPYVGARFGFLVGDTKDIAEDAGRDSSPIYFIAGARLAF